MSLSNQGRTVRAVELATKENEIAALYRMCKSDEEIAAELDIAAALVKTTRDGMGLPPLRSSSGRLWTPDADRTLLRMRDVQGKFFSTIAALLGYSNIDVEVRYRILKRLEMRAATMSHKATIPCLLCRQPFVSEDRRKIRFCQPCRSDEVSKADSSPFDPMCASGTYSVRAPAAPGDFRH